MSVELQNGQVGMSISFFTSCLSVTNLRLFTSDLDVKLAHKQNLVGWVTYSLEIYWDIPG